MTQKLTDLLTVHKSDKHLLGYASVYQTIFAQILNRAPSKPLKVVEIEEGLNKYFSTLAK